VDALGILGAAAVEFRLFRLSVFDGRALLLSGLRSSPLFAGLCTLHRASELRGQARAGWRI
jgi:hypothetical protein